VIQFDDLISDYSPPTIFHDVTARKSYIFVKDSWLEAGEIKETGKYFHSHRGTHFEFARLTPPDVEEFAENHSDEGVLDWLIWGPRVN
jgi:hypothetical protein